MTRAQMILILVLIAISAYVIAHLGVDLYNWRHP